MRWLGSLCVGGWILSSWAFAQEPRMMTLDVITLRMPAGLASQLQRRIDEGGEAATTAVDRLPALAKDKKLDELDRWHVTVESGKVCKREIARGLDLKMSDGEIVPVGLKIDLEPSLSSSRGVVDVRMAIEETSSMKSDRDHYLLRQAGSAASIRANEWVNLATWSDEDQVVSFLARFSGTNDVRNEETSGGEMQTSVRYSLCVLADSAAKAGFHRQVSGAPALALMKDAQVLEAGSMLIRRDQPWVFCSNANPLKLVNNGEPGKFDLEGCVLFSADHRTAEAGIVVELKLHRDAGGPRRSVEFRDWFELPVGSVTMIPLDENAGRENLWLAIEFTTEFILPIQLAREGVVVPPCARRRLAEAAGLPVPKPGVNKRGFEALPTVRESLEKLGLEIPAGVEVRLDPAGPSIWMVGNDAPHAQLREILTKHLPAGAISSGTSEGK